MNFLKNIFVFQCEKPSLPGRPLHSIHVRFVRVRQAARPMSDRTHSDKARPRFFHAQPHSKGGDSNLRERVGSVTASQRLPPFQPQVLISS